MIPPEKMLGKLEDVTFGYGGYQDAQLGVAFKIGGAGWGTTDFWGCWGMEPSERANWTREEQEIRLGKTVLRLRDILRDAKVQHVHQLKGKPIEATFDGTSLKSWRILTEVL